MPIRAPATVHAVLRHVLCLAVLISSVVAAQAADFLVVDGEVANEQHLSEADFRAMTRTSVQAPDSTGQVRRYEGVMLKDLLAKAGVPLGSALKGADVAKYLQAMGADGFVAVFALPEFDAGQFLVADTIDGQSLPEGSGPLQVVSPGETRRSRWVKQLVRLRIVRAQ